MPDSGQGQGDERKYKVNGISIWSDITPRAADDYAFVERTNATWISLQPYGVLMTDSTGVEFDRDDIWECSSFDGLIKHINIAHDLGYHVFVKPHLIVKYDEKRNWTGNIDFNREAKWETFEESYQNYLIELAIICDSLNVEMLSMGTELGSFTRQREEHWRGMIDTVRSHFGRALTYCANFDEYQKFPHWSKLDLIGVDAYFTVDPNKKTSLDRCREGWKPVARKLKAFSEEHDKFIFFSEFGYTSTDYCAFKPFGGHGNGDVNLVAQANAYRAVFDTFWDEPWFTGGFSWFWRFDNDQPENYDNTSFSPQNKPAEEIIAKNFLIYR